MKKTQRLRLRDVRKIYRLLGECRELGSDSREWRLHAARSLCELVGAEVGIAGKLREFRTGSPRITEIVDDGWAGQRERRNYLDFLREYGPANNPQYQPMSRLPSFRIATRSRRQLVADSQWYRSEHFAEQRRPSRIDGSLLSLSTAFGGPEGDGADQPLFVLALNRALGERPFEKRERLIVHWFHHELAPLIGKQLAIHEESAAPKLSPRQRQVLACLVKGDSEKQVARELALSPQTVHDYVKALYRRVGVHNRAELLAWWLEKNR